MAEWSVHRLQQMSSKSDVNQTFSQLAVLIIAGGVISSFTAGGAGILGAIIVCYFMLVATNAISRGENSHNKTKK